MSREQQEPDGSAASRSAGSPSVVPAPTPRAVSDPAGVPPQEELQAIEQRVRRTRVSATWVGILVAIVVLVLLLIFILDNLREVEVTFFGASGQIPLGVALLFAAVGGALLVAIVGVARLTQLRLNARQRRHASTHARRNQDHPDH